MTLQSLREPLRVIEVGGLFGVCGSAHARYVAQNDSDESTALKSSRTRGLKCCAACQQLRGVWYRELYRKSRDLKLSCFPGFTHAKLQDALTRRIIAEPHV